MTVLVTCYSCCDTGLSQLVSRWFPIVSSGGLTIRPTSTFQTPREQLASVPHAQASHLTPLDSQCARHKGRCIHMGTSFAGQHTRYSGSPMPAYSLRDQCPGLTYARARVTNKSYSYTSNFAFAASRPAYLVFTASVAKWEGQTDECGVG